MIYTRVASFLWDSYRSCTLVSIELVWEIRLVKGTHWIHKSNIICPLRYNLKLIGSPGCMLAYGVTGVEYTNKSWFHGQCKQGTDVAQKKDTLKMLQQHLHHSSCHFNLKLSHPKLWWIITILHNTFLPGTRSLHQQGKGVQHHKEDSFYRFAAHDKIMDYCFNTLRRL